MPTRAHVALVALIIAAALVGCQPADRRVEIRFGYFPNLTHAPAIVGVEDGILAEALGDSATLAPQVFNAGPEVVEAIFTGALDVSFIGPNPAINAFVRSDGEAIRIVSGSTSGGASLVVRDGIEDPADLAGTTLATPQLGNTQDVALRAWLGEQGYVTDTEGGGDVSVQPIGNAQALEAFIAGEVDGAWLPEPWATRMVDEGGGQVLVDERDLWPNGEFVTTHVIVAIAFLDAHPDVVRRLIEGVVAATDAVNADPGHSREVVAASIEELTGTAVSVDLLAAAWDELTFTVDPIASSLTESANDALALGLLESADLDGIYDLETLNEVLAATGAEPVSGP
jgi:NitT/TauT family transport system substrate-binding protein